MNLNPPLWQPRLRILLREQSFHTTCMLPISELKRNKMTKGAYDSSELAKRVVLSANVIPN